MNKLRLQIFLIVTVLLVQPLARADWLEVNRAATLKKEPASGADILLHLDVGDHVTFVSEQQVNGYYQVKAADGQTGWIYRSLVSRHSEPMPTSMPASAPGIGKLEIHILNVGQADAILIRCPEGNHELLIDAADSRYPSSGSDFKAKMHQLQADDNPLEVVVATHPHTDHIGNMAWVLNTYSVGLYVDDGCDYNSAMYRNVEQAREKNGCRYWSVQDDIVPDVDFCTRPDVDARVLRPKGFGNDKNPNNNSVVVRVDYGETSFLFVGDAAENEEAQLLTDPSTRALLDCDFLKVGHHGSDTSSATTFLDAVSPKIAAISCGAKNVGTNSTYKHPRAVTIQALQTRVGPREGAASTIEAYDGETAKWRSFELNTAVYVTTQDGDLVFESDGHKISRRQ